jgi:hypothetical protein
MQIKFPAKHHKSLYDLIANLSRFFKSPNKKKQFIATFSELLGSYLPPHGLTTGLINMCQGQNSLQINENMVSHFPVKVYKGCWDLVETVMTPSNCRSSRLTLVVKDNFDFALPKPLYVHTYIIKPNLIGHSYVRLLTSLRLPSTQVTIDFSIHCTNQWNNLL